MTKQEAIEKIKQTQNSEWAIDEAKLPLGNLAKLLLTTERNTFKYGMEYGAIAILMEIHGITKDELL